MFTEIISTLDSLDIQLFTWLNTFHSPFFDTLMWTLSAKETWVPLYICITVLLFVKNWKQALIILVMIAICITLADQISSTLIKEFVARPRPSHNDALAGTIHILNNYRGSPFGFVSSHAANTFAFIVLLGMIIRNRCFVIVGTVWASAVAYSRIYLGVHYPGDIIGGIA
ncbi:MAG: phosphatase PAP2 family protein, partial [Muribaculaceae bacterium]